MPLDKDKFKSVTKLVIDKLEGGYFHPNMRTANPKKFGSYHRSGETMFGLDRHAGHGLYYSTPRKSDDVLSNLKNIESGVYTYKTPESKEFWTTIDKANAKNNWKWLYRGGSLENKLKDLTAEIMLPSYERNAVNYLDAKTREIVETDNRLLFHFIYASWNGSGWFKKFASDMNKAVKSGTTDTNKLAQIALNSRTKEGYKTGSAPNSLIAQGGRKIAEIFKSFKDLVSEPAVKKTISGALIFALMVGAYFFFKRK
tara:strand:- start:916 stop:1683 length:768 start_codon:yes stop_codon:yes gene_type:complete